MITNINLNDSKAICLFSITKKTLTPEQYHLINDVESWLCNFNTIEVAIENLEKELSMLDGSIQAQNTTLDGGRSSKISNTAESILFKKELLKQKINTMTIRKNQLERAFEILNQDEFMVIRNFYIEGKRYREFIDDLALTLSSCKRIKKRALEKIIIAIYGIC